MDESFKEDFEKVLEDCKKKYEQKKAEYGDSWKSLPHTSLRARIEQEYKEWLAEAARWTQFQDGKQPMKEYKELLDIINVTLMLATRIKREEKI